jgi:hypothetical protein
MIPETPLIIDEVASYCLEIDDWFLDLDQVVALSVISNALSST